MCDYDYWHLKSIPCVYALACLNTIRNTNKEEYTDHYFQTKTWKKCYICVIDSNPSQNLWSLFQNNDNLTPLEVKRLLGRQKKNRYRDAFEKQLPLRRPIKKKYNCTKCRGVGHDSRSFTN